jgi:hypothetical protein
MMSPSFSPEKNSFISKEIIAIREEITLIESHRTEHMQGLRVRQAESSCKYCQPYLSQPKEKAKIAEHTPLATANDLERTVETSGKKGQITVPRGWAGKKVRVTII